MPAPPLREIQAAFWRGLTDPDRPAGILPLVRPEGPISPEKRFDIYAGMYRARLVDALREDFSRVAAALGDEGFTDLVHAYVAAHPSSHPSLVHLGAGLPAFIAEGRVSGVPGFLADLARLEWARIEVFGAPDGLPLSLGELRAVPVDAWPALRFSLVPAARLLELAWPVHELWVDAGRSGTLRPRKVALRVWRDGFVVYQAPMASAEDRALARLVAGEPFGEVCEAFESPEEAAGQLLRWVADGLLAGA
jgi:hypothetical protein